MKEGCIVVLLTLLLVLVGLAVALALEDGEDAEAPPSATLACVTGEAAENETRTRPDGGTISVPRSQPFETLAEARRFACVDAPQPGTLGGWQVAGYTGRRTASLGEEGRRAVMIEYRLADARDPFLYLHVSNRIPRFDDTPEEQDPNIERVAVDGQPAVLRHFEPGRFDLSWNRGVLRFAVNGQLPENMNFEEDVLPLLESME